MSTRYAIEAIGYVGSALVLVSMLMTSVVRLRIINLIGSIIFALYAIAIGSYPTAIMNIALAIINIYHLYKIFNEQKSYHMIETEVNDGFFEYLLDTFDKDIRFWFPEYSRESISADIAYIVCCESDPACLFLGKESFPGDIEVVIDYATPAYRDTSVGRYLHKKLAVKGYKSVVFRQNAADHIPYLKKIGYVEGENGEYVITLNGHGD